MFLNPYRFGRPSMRSTQPWPPTARTTSVRSVSVVVVGVFVHEEAEAARSVTGMRSVASRATVLVAAMNELLRPAPSPSAVQAMSQDVDHVAAGCRTKNRAARPIIMPGDAADPPWRTVRSIIRPAQMGFSAPPAIPPDLPGRLPFTAFCSRLQAMVRKTGSPSCGRRVTGRIRDRAGTVRVPPRSRVRLVGSADEGDLRVVVGGAIEQVAVLVAQFLVEEGREVNALDFDGAVGGDRAECLDE